MLNTSYCSIFSTSPFLTINTSVFLVNSITLSSYLLVSNSKLCFTVSFTGSYPFITPYTYVLLMISVIFLSGSISYSSSNAGVLLSGYANQFPQSPLYFSFNLNDSPFFTISRSTKYDPSSFSSYTLTVTSLSSGLLSFLYNLKDPFIESIYFLILSLSILSVLIFPFLTNNGFLS